MLTVQVGFGLQRNPEILKEKREMILDAEEKKELQEVKLPPPPSPPKEQKGKKTKGGKGKKK